MCAGLFLPESSKIMAEMESHSMPGASKGEGDEKDDKVEIPQPESKGEGDEKDEKVEIPQPESKGRGDEKDEKVEVPQPESKGEGDEKDEKVEIPQPESKGEGDEKDEKMEVPQPERPARRSTTPSLLKELGMKVTTNGVLLPESRKTLLRRRRETRQAALANEVPPGAIVGGQSALAKRKRGGNEATPVLLDEVESDLFYGAHQGSVSVCAAAVAKGVDVNVRTKADLDGVGIGASALHVAAVRGHEDVAAALLHVKADAMAMTGRGETPVQLATRMGHVEVVKVLRTAGAAPQHAEGVLQLMSSAPSNWRDGQRKKLRRALAGDVERPRSKEAVLPQLPPPPPPPEGSPETKMDDVRL